MARLTEALMTPGKGYMPTGAAPMANLALGGQNGWTPNLTEWVSNQAYISRPLVCILLEAPKIFNSFPDPDKWKDSLKALFELHARTIDGFNAGLKVDVEEHPVGGAGEMQQEFTNVTRERSQPKFTFIEKYGRPIQTLLEFWIRYGMMDPETKFALGGTFSSTLDTSPTELTADWYTATCLFMVPDPLHKKVDKAWITTNMFPMGMGDVVAKRDLTSAQEMLTLDVEFTGVSQYGLGVNNFAQTVLDGINITGADPYLKHSFLTDSAKKFLGGPNGDASATTGYSKSVTESLNSVVKFSTK